MEYDKKAIGRRLRELRRKKGKTQRDVAADYILKGDK